MRRALGRAFLTRADACHRRGIPASCAARLRSGRLPGRRHATDHLDAAADMFPERFELISGQR